jgi:two-component system OmpR family sensor kinase
MIAQSIRFRITLVYTAILTLTLLAFSLAVYQNFSRSLRRSLDGLLKSKAEGVSDSIETYWETETLPAEGQPARTAAANKVDNINFLRVARRWIKEKSGDPDLMNITVQIFGADGSLLAASQALPEETVVSARRLALAGRGRAEFYDRDVPLARETPEPLRFYVLPVLENARLTYFIQVGSPLSSLKGTLDRLKTLLFLIVPLTVILTGLAGLVLVRMTLRPVDRMVRTLSEVKAARLGLRLRLPRTNDEIRRLAETFNRLLDRLEADFLNQRRFSQDLSHELRTPLTILRGEFEVALKKPRTSREYRAVLRTGLEEVDILGRIIDELMTLARWENREIELRLTTFDLAALAERTVEEFRVLAASKGLGLERRGLASLPFTGDEGQVRTALINLIDNAIKYTPRGGTIEVGVARAEGASKVTVQDDGPGIPEDKLPLIFERFYRGEDSRTSSGFGLGLSIVRSIVMAHGGTVAVDSRPGRGTVFTLTFPPPRTD